MSSAGREFTLMNHKCFTGVKLEIYRQNEEKNNLIKIVGKVAKPTHKIFNRLNRSTKNCSPVGTPVYSTMKCVATVAFFKPASRKLSLVVRLTKRWFCIGVSFALHYCTLENEKNGLPSSSRAAAWLIGFMYAQNSAGKFCDVSECRQLLCKWINE